jgi:hypothetical protein
MWLSGFAVPIAFCAVFLCSDPASAGGWAADTLSNDDASDLLGQIPNGGVEAIRSALDAALTPESPVNDERASRALAAAENGCGDGGKTVTTCSMQRMGGDPFKRCQSRPHRVCGQSRRSGR